MFITIQHYKYYIIVWVYDQKILTCKKHSYDTFVNNLKYVCNTVI